MPAIICFIGLFLLYYSKDTLMLVTFYCYFESFRCSVRRF